MYSVPKRDVLWTSLQSIGKKTALAGQQTGVGPNLAMFVATVKASLVAFFFMHLLWDDKKNLTMFLMSLMFFGIFVTITMLDTEFRGDLGLNPETKDPINKRAAFYDTLPLTDTHGHPVDEHSDEHHEDKDHH